jgi:hypothetical protein
MNTKLRLTVGAALVASALSTLAADFEFGNGLKASLSGTATLGTTLRMDDPNPEVYALIPSTVVGAKPGLLIGQTGGSDLNYAKGHAVSTVAKAVLDFDVHGKNLGFFLRASAWHDFVLGHDNAAYGNYPNGFTPNAPLSDRGLAPEAKFSNIIAREAYLYGKFDGAGVDKVDVRLGRQVLNWGLSQFFNGGISTAVNPVDFASQLRPGALPSEAKVPVGMLSVALSNGKDWEFNGFLPYEFRSAVMPGCGSFFDVASIVQPGCSFSGAIAAPIAGTPLSTLQSLTEHSLLASGYYLHRNPDLTPSVAGNVGLSMRLSAPSWNTDFRGYLLNTASSIYNAYYITIENVNGATLPAGLAGGLGRLANPNGLKYGVTFAPSVHTLGFSFDTKLDPTLRLFGELAYRANQPLGMSPIDLLNAGLLRAPTTLLAIQTNVLATPAGSNFEAYQRFGVTTANLGVNKVFAKALGAERVVLAGELGMSQVSDLPDPTTMRFGRGLAYGSAPYVGVNGALTACSESAPGLNGVPGKTCTSDGFVSSSAWGLRGRIAATYANVLGGAALTPSLTLAKDVSGYSYDGTFSQGRVTARAALRADWGKRYFGEVAYTYMGGGNYNLMLDRSNLSLTAGVNF